MATLPCPSIRSCYTPARRRRKYRASSAGLGRFRVEQAVQVDDEIAHMGVVDGLLRRRLPGRVRRLVVRIDADDVELVEIDELGPARVLELAAEHQMQELLGHL